MAKWNGPGVIRINEKNYKPGEEIDLSLIEDTQRNRLIDKGMIDGKKTSIKQSSGSN